MSWLASEVWNDYKNNYTIENHWTQGQLEWPRITQNLDLMSQTDESILLNYRLKRVESLLCP